MAMKLDHEDLNRLIEKISTSDIQEFLLEGEDFKLEIKRNLFDQNKGFDNLISTNYQSIREVNYNYHLNGLDLLINNDTLAKTNIIDALLNFEQINRFRPNSLLQQIFFQSKNDEIFNLFLKHQNKMEIEEIKNLLNSIAPFYSSNWTKL